MHQANLSKLVLAIALVAALACVSLIGVATPARADASTIPWTAGTPVLGSTGGTDNSYSRVLVDNLGHMYVFFQTSTAANQANVTVTKYTLSPGFAPQFVFTRSVNNGDMSLAYATLMSVAMDAHGNVYCAWTKSPLYTIGHGAEIIVSMSADGGSTWSQVVQASSPSSYGNNEDPSIAVNPVDGSIWVSWDQAWDGSYNITMSHSVNQGVSFTGFANITDQEDSLTVWPQLGIDSLGRMYVLFENATPVSGVPFALYWMWSDGGATWSAPQPITTPLVAAFTPTLVVDSSDHIHVAWYDWRKTPSGDNSVHYRMSADRGATWTADLPVTQGSIVSGNFPSVAAHGSTVIVSWPSTSGGLPGLGYAISVDGGLTFRAEQISRTANAVISPGSMVADVNDTFYASYGQQTAPHSIAFKIWVGPPSRPTITSITPGTGQLTVAWSLVSEPNVVEYVVYRSTDGVTYQAVATVGPATTSYLDPSLANGTYWYTVQAVNSAGVPGLASAPWSAVVGPSTAQLIAQLQAQINTLESELNSANANLATIQTQLTAIKNQAAAIQGNTSALQNQITNLQNQLNNLQSQQATQTMSYANLAFEIIVVVLLVVLLLNQMRRPKSPQIMMAQPAQAAPPAQSPPPKPEDDL